MAIHNKLKIFFAFLFLTVLTSFGFSKVVYDDFYGYSLDLVEGFSEIDNEGDLGSHQFQHDNFPLNFIAKVYDGYGFYETEEAISYALDRLSSSYEVDNFEWNNTTSCIASFLFHLDQDYSGWACAAPLGTDTYIVLLTYAPKDISEACNDFMISSLNSLCINEYFYNNPGIVVTYAFPSLGEEEVVIEINGVPLSFTMDKVDSEASQFIVDLEFRILTKYASHPLMYEAWDRYYRTIYRDNYGRISELSRVIYDTLYPIAEEEREDNPMIQYAQYILSWVQNMDYVRAEDKSQSDFTSLPRILKGIGSDCDSRSLLVSSILEYSGVDCLLLVYPEYSHAILACQIDAPGQKFINPLNKEEYIMGETTAKVTWGTIAQEQTNKDKCFFVSLP